MEHLIRVIVVIIGIWFSQPKPPLTPPIFTLHQTHIQYIQDSIQRPIPREQVKILFHFGYSHPNLKGLTHQIDKNRFIIHLNRFHIADWWKVIHHELVHVKQLTNQELQTHATYWQWHDQKYGFQTPYAKRPWELEAFRQADQIETRTLHD